MRQGLPPWQALIAQRRENKSAEVKKHSGWKQKAIQAV
jgi:hypothetical protein